MNLKEDLLRYHSPGNRYAYYPPAKSWRKDIPIAALSFKKETSLYLHLPFCESLCTFCGCNIRISKREEDHLSYIDALRSEWSLLKSSDTHGPLISHIRATQLNALILGGGTPSALRPKALDKLAEFLTAEIPHGFADLPQASLTEASPQSFNRYFYQFAHSLGIKRFSFGVQDFNEDITANVNRHQKREDLESALKLLSTQDSAGIDLIWGLPHQSPATMKSWSHPLKELPLDWVSFYPLAKVGWLESYQNAFGDFTLPDLPSKYQLYQEGIDILHDAGFEHFAFGHFIKKNGKLWQSYKDQALTRYVCGLFPQHLGDMLGIGVGALSHIDQYHTQNEKILDKYLHFLHTKKKSPLLKAHKISEDERLFGQLIHNIIEERSLPQHKLSLFTPQEREEWFVCCAEKTSITPYGSFFLKNIIQRLESH